MFVYMIVSDKTYEFLLSKIKPAILREALLNKPELRWHPIHSLHRSILVGSLNPLGYLY